MGGHYGLPLEKDSRDQIWGQIDLWPKNVCEIRLRSGENKLRVKGVPKKKKNNSSQLI